MKKHFWLIVIIVAAVKISIMQAIPVSAIGYNIHDDTLFLSQAGGFGLWLSKLFGLSGQLADMNLNVPHSTLLEQLTNGGWLGQYNELILSKGPVYGIWIAFCLLTGLPLLTAQQLLYSCAAVMVIISLRKEVSSQSLLFLGFTFLLFNPEFVSRVVRSGIYPALSILIMVGLFGIYSCRHQHWKQLGAWALFLSCILPLFWLTREEGIWLIPSVLLVLGSTILAVYYHHGFGRQLITKAFLVSLPFLFLFTATHVVSSLNNRYYGSKCVVELKSDSFLRGYGALLRVKDEKKPYIVVPAQVREKLYAVSPAFRQLKPFFESEKGKMWQQFGCRAYPETCGEIASGWFLWAFRDGVALSGHHTDGQKASAYYQQLAREINTACDDGRLSCLPERHTLMPPLDARDYFKIIGNIPKGLMYLLHFEYLLDRLNQPFYSSGPSEALHYYQDMTGERIAPTKDGSYQLPPEPPIQAMLNSIRLKVLKTIAAFYSSVTASLFFLALFLYFFCLGHNLLKKQLTPLTLFSTALIIGISSRLTILSLIDITSFQGFNHYYLSPLYGFVLLFISIVFIDFFQSILLKKQNVLESN